MKTKAGKIVKLAALAILAAAAVCGIGVYRYVSNVPELTANNWLQDVVADNTLSWNNLYNIKCSGDYSVELRILDTNIPDAKISEDKAEVYVGSKAGYIHLSAIGQGKRSEYGKETDTYIYTTLGADERADAEEKVRAAFEYADKAARKEYFGDEEAELVCSAATLTLYGCSDEPYSLKPTYYTRYEKENGEAVYLEIDSRTALNEIDPAQIEFIVKEEELHDSTSGLAVNFNNLLSSDDIAENMVISDEFRSNRLSPDMVMKFDPEKISDNKQLTDEMKDLRTRSHFIYYIIGIN